MRNFLPILLALALAACGDRTGKQRAGGDASAPATPTPAGPPMFVQRPEATPSIVETYQQAPDRDTNDPRAVQLDNPALRIGGSPYGLRVKGENLEGARVFLGSGERRLELVRSQHGPKVVFREDQIVEDLPAGKYDLLVVRRNGVQTVVPGAVTLQE
jgi:hypothetical protein